MQELTPEVPEAAGGAPEPVGEVVEKSAEGGGGFHVAKGCPGGGNPIPRDPRRGAYPLGADDGGYIE
jgi:hypothetical protein